MESFIKKPISGALPGSTAAAQESFLRFSPQSAFCCLLCGEAPSRHALRNGDSRNEPHAHKNTYSLWREKIRKMYTMRYFSNPTISYYFYIYLHIINIYLILTSMYNGRAIGGNTIMEIRKPEFSSCFLIFRISLYVFETLFSNFSNLGILAQLG